MKRKIFCVLVLLFCSTAPFFTVYAQDSGGALAQAIPEEWVQAAQNTPVTAEEFQEMTLADYIENLLRLLNDSMRAPLRLMAKICGVLILSAFAKGLCRDNTSSQLIGLMDTVITLGVFALCSTPILSMMSVLQTALEESRIYIASFVPVFASVMISCGQPAGAVVYSGLFLSAAMLIADALCRLGLPLTRVFLALNATSCVGSTIDLSGVTTSLSKWLKWFLTLCATVFATILGLQSVLAQTADSVALKTGKFLIGSSVPVIGRAVSDAVGSVFAGLRLVKGTLGFAVIAVIVAAFLPLILQCAVYHFALYASSVVADATGNTKSAKLLGGFSECISLYISMTFFFCLIVIISTLIMIITGSGG